MDHLLSKCEPHEKLPITIFSGKNCFGEKVCLYCSAKYLRPHNTIRICKKKLKSTTKKFDNSNSMIMNRKGKDLMIETQSIIQHKF